jgi:hypothetical protein
MMKSRCGGTTAPAVSARNDHLAIAWMMLALIATLAAAEAPEFACRLTAELKRMLATYLTSTFTGKTST